MTLDGPLEHVPGHKYAIGVDLGITNDRSVCAVMHAERAENDDGRKVVQRVVLDRMEVWTPTRGNPVDLTAVEEWIALASRQYRAHVQIDPYQAVAMTQRLRNKGVSIDEFTFSQASVGRLAMALHTTIRDHRLAIPNDPELIDELVNVRLRETSPNVYRLDHDPDRHDDRAIAMALAILSLTTTSQASGPITYTDEEWAIIKLEQARALGQVPQPVKLMGAFGATDWSTGIVDDDEPEFTAGATAKSPFS